MNTTTDVAVSPTPEAHSVRWRQVGAFLGLTFGLTSVCNLYLALSGGLGATPAIGLLLQGMMLIPACSALVLQLFVFSDSPLYFRGGFTWLRVFCYFFLAYSLVFWVAGVASVGATSPGFLMSLQTTTQFLTLGGLVFVIVLQFLSPKAERKAVGLTFGHIKWYALFALLLVALYSLMTALNHTFGLGEAVDAKAVIGKLAQASGQPTTGLEQMPAMNLLLLTGLKYAVLSPLIALLITFGEEYGWRGFLQGELVKMGRVKGVALVGLIWGLWHAPVIVMGYNYPGYPVAGVLLMTLYCVCLGFILGLAYLKSGSVWLAAYLHGVNNQTMSFLSMLVYKPSDPVFSFGIGIYGLVIFALVGGVLLLDKTWRR